MSHRPQSWPVRLYLAWKWEGVRAPEVRQLIDAVCWPLSLLLVIAIFYMPQFWRHFIGV